MMGQVDIINNTLGKALGGAAGTYVQYHVFTCSKTTEELICVFRWIHHRT